MNNFETVKECTIFKNFSIDEIIEIFSVISFYEKDYKKNDIILAENTKVEYFGIITNGKIALSNFDYFGNRNILNVFEKGDSFAEALVSLEIQIPHEVISLTDSSIVWIEYKSLSKSLYYQKILNNLLNTFHLQKSYKKVFHFHLKSHKYHMVFLSYNQLFSNIILQRFKRKIPTL